LPRLHDAAVGIGDIGLGFLLRSRRHRPGLPAPLLLAGGRFFRPSLSQLLLGDLGYLEGPFLQPCLGLQQPLEAIGSSSQTLRQLIAAAVRSILPILGFVGRFGLG
jgi:hypothetical protein